MKVLSVEAPCHECPHEFNHEFPAGTVLKGKTYGHVYLVSEEDGDKIVTRLHDGKVVGEMLASEYEVVPKGSKITLEV